MSKEVLCDRCLFWNGSMDPEHQTRRGGPASHGQCHGITIVDGKITPNYNFSEEDFNTKPGITTDFGFTCEYATPRYCKHCHQKSPIPDIFKHLKDGHSMELAKKLSFNAPL